MKRFKLIRDIRLGIKNLLLHKLRSMLTMLGVVFGVGSVVAMLAVGEGASKEALDQIRRLGSTNIILTSMKPSGDAEAGSMRSFMSVYGLLYDDEIRIRESFPHINTTAPVRVFRKEGRLGPRIIEIRVLGTTEKWFDLVRRPMIGGRGLHERDLENSSAVCVLTELGARKLLATEHTIGEKIKIDKGYFEVIGIVKSDSGNSTSIESPDQDVDAYIPINVATERFGEVISRRVTGSFERELVELHQILVEVESTDHVESASKNMETMLKRFHPKKDYKISVPLALLRQAERTKRTFNIVLGSIAGISLLVGGIGIMNIMLASVTERTREIGIRRAIGAKRKQIIVQFLIETVVLSTIGGGIGIGIGLVIPWLIEKFAEMPTVVTPWSIVLSMGISAAVGIVFGLYPAIRAANLDPIVALRHE